MKIERTPFITSLEFAHISKMNYEFILNEICEVLLADGKDPNQYWITYHDVEAGVDRKVLALPEYEALLVVSGEWFAHAAYSAVAEVFENWKNIEEQSKAYVQLINNNMRTE